MKSCTIKSAALKLQTLNLKERKSIGQLLTFLAKISLCLEIDCFLTKAYEIASEMMFNFTNI